MVTTNARKARRAAAAVGAGSGAKPGEVKSIASDPGKAKNVISLNGSNDSNVKGNGQHAASRSPRGKDSTSKRGKRRNGRRSNGGGGRGGDGEAEVDRDVTQEKPVAVKTASPQEPPKADIAGYDADDFMSGGFMSALGDDHGSGEPATNGIVDDGMVDDGDDDDEEDDDDDNNESDDSGDEDANANAMDLKGLAETDPEFFDFLQKEEPTLLEFDPMGSDDSDEEQDQAAEVDAGGLDVASGERPAKSAAALLREASRGRGVTLTMSLLQAMQEDAFDRKTVKGVRRIIKAFHCGCHLGDEAGDGKGGGSAAPQKFRIPSSEVHNELMVSTLEGLHAVVMSILFPEKSRLQQQQQQDKEEPAAKKTHASEKAVAVPVAPSAIAAIAADGRGSDKKRIPKKRRRHEVVQEPAGETDEAEPDADKPAKRKRKDREGEDILSKGAVKADSGAGKKKSGRDMRAAAGKVVVVLTKEDFKAAALLPAWKAMQPALYSFFKSLLHVLEELRDRALLAFLLSRLEHYVPFLVPYPGLGRGFLKALLGLWGGAGAEAKSAGKGSEEEGQEAERVRLLAYLRIRQMAATLPSPFAEGCMKGLYLAFAKRARAPPASQAGKVSLRVMEGCVVELYGMDIASAYQNAFLYIRQLSLLLRRAMQQKSKDSVQAVRRWQVVTCLRVWTGVLAAAPAEDELRMLIFPLAQVVEGIIRLSASLRHSPLMFQLVRMRQRLAAAAALYVPCSSPLLEVIRSPALFKKASASTGAPPNVPAILRLGKTQVDEGRAQGAVVGEAFRLVSQEMDLYRYSAAFPELVIPVLGQLRKFAKTTKVAKWRMMTRGLMETLETRATWAAGRRLELRLDPSEVDGLEVLRPDGAPTMRERLGASEATVEAIDDDATTVAPMAATQSKKIKAKEGGKKKHQQRAAIGDDEGDDSMEEDDDSEIDSDDDAANAARSSLKREKASPSQGGGSGKRKPMEEAEEVGGDMSAPDVVEDLGSWSDDD